MQGDSLVVYRYFLQIDKKRLQQQAPYLGGADVHAISRRDRAAQG